VSKSQASVGGLTFGEYLRRRKSYTEAGAALRDALAGMPEAIQTTRQVYAWLDNRGASRLACATARRAAKDWRQRERERLARGGRQP
jgi:hypothetical protein